MNGSQIINQWVNLVSLKKIYAELTNSLIFKKGEIHTFTSYASA